MRILLFLFALLASLSAFANPEQRIKELGIELKTKGTPQANFVYAVRTGNLLFTAGHIPVKDNGKVFAGKVGKDLSTEEGQEAARLAAILLLGTLKQELGDLNKVKRVVKVLGMVNATPEFQQHSTVINGFSDLIVDVFGAQGKHARSAVGMGSLPVNAAVEIEMIVELHD